MAAIAPRLPHAAGAGGALSPKLAWVEPVSLALTWSLELLRKRAQSSATCVSKSSAEGGVGEDSVA
jgi:hypothetical protein